MSCECFVDVDDFGVVVFWVSVGVLSVLVDDFVGVLEDFGSGGGLFFLFVGHGRFGLFVLGVLGCFKKWARLLWVFCFVYCAVFFCGGGLSSAGGSAVCGFRGAFSAVLVHRCVSCFSFRVSLGP